MSYNLNWPRWIEASINVYFDANKPDIKMIVEAQPRDTNDKQDLFEVRLDGPDSYEVSKDYWMLDVEINILVQSIIDNINIYRHGVIIGQIAAIFTTSIPVRKCGDQPGDDDSFVGCLIIKQDVGRRDAIEISRFGQIEQNLPLEQTTIEGHYRMTLEEN